MRKTFVLGIAAMLLALAPTSAEARCEYEWVCDETGDCAQVPICDRTIDITPPKPPSIKPIVPPSIRPIERPTVPPIGTRDCTQVRRRDASGNWHWDTVCY